jgi:hypothetical protein
MTSLLAAVGVSLFIAGTTYARPRIFASFGNDAEIATVKRSPGVDVSFSDRYSLHESRIRCA